MRGIFKRKRIYLDYAASTPLSLDAHKKMEPYFWEHYGNAGALHKEGSVAKQALEDARSDIAQAIKVHPEEIIFTGSGTEGNNLAILGYMEALKLKKGTLKNTHVITSSAEHPSVLECFRSFESEGVSIDMVDFDERGIINPKEVRALLKKETVFVSIAYVNNEIGTVQPIKAIAEEIRAHEKEKEKEKKGKMEKIIFHTDASQAPLYFDCTTENLGIDLMTIDGQKIYGPKGVGFLYVRKGVMLKKIMNGGSQEFGLRPGTENIPLIVGLQVSFTDAVLGREKEVKKIKALQEFFLAELKKEIPQAILNGDPILRSPNNINISIPGIDNEYMVIVLDEHGVAAATKSACLGHGNGEHSYVVASLYNSNKKNKGDKEGDQTNTLAKSAIRFSLGSDTTKRDISYVISILLREAQKIDKVVL